MSEDAQKATLGVRLIALLIGLVSVWQLLGNVLDSVSEFDPNYLGYYFSSQLLRPALGLGLALVILVLSKWLGKQLSKGLS